MPHLVLSFFGGFQVMLDGRPATEFKSNKIRALLAYLAVDADRPHSREALAGLLWPDRTDRDALSNLRYSLARLRKTLGDPASDRPFLLVTHQTIQFNRASDFWLDVAELDRHIGSSRLPAAEIGDLKSALALYRGTFLEGFSVGDAAPFEEWALLRREQITQHVLAALDALVAALADGVEYKEAQAYARQQVALDPWNEAAHRTLMRALALDEQRSAALHQFRICRRILIQELGIEPSEETVALYEAIREGKGETRRQVDKDGSRPGNRTTSLSTCLLVSPSPLPFVAREEPLARLDHLLNRALAGAGSVIFVAGEAGSGKTALLGEFARRAMQAHPALLVARGVCDAATGLGDPYLPFREILQLLTGDIEPKRAGAALTPEHARRLWAALPDAVQALAAQGPDLIDTLVPEAGLALRVEAFARQASRGARLAQTVHARAGSGRSARQTLQLADIFDQVTHVLQTLARQHPLVVLLDDLQWADAGSIGLLFHLGRRLAASPILVVGAYRPDVIARLSERERHPLELVVNELLRISGQAPIDLDACEGQAFVNALLDGESNRLGIAFRRQLYHHTEGQPLFTTELLRCMKDQGDLVRDGEGRWVEGPALHWDQLPVRVESAIAERIHRLPDRCRALLAAASVEGEEFTAEVAARALDETEAAAAQCLSRDLDARHRLVVAASLHRLGAHKISRYRFRHNLFQRYLYDHLDPVTRATLHEAVGSALEELYAGAPDELEALAPRLAWHFEAAGLADQAARYCLQAGCRAVRLAAQEEAITHLTRGLALLETLPESPERVRLKLDLQLALLSPYAFARGYTTPEWIQTMERAGALADHPWLAGSPQRGLALIAMAFYATWTGEPDRAVQIGDRLLETTADGPQWLHQREQIHLVLGTARFLCGDFVAAHCHLERTQATRDLRSPHPLDLMFGIDMRVASQGWDMLVLWLLGYPDQAVQRLQRTLATAQENGHHGTLAFARSIAAIAFLLLGDGTAASNQLAALEELQSVHEEQPAFGAWMSSLSSWDPAWEAALDVRLRQARQGTAASGVMGSGVGRVAQLLLLARGHVQAGQVAAGLGVLDEALAWIETSGVRSFEAEVYRLKAELILLDQSSQTHAVRSAKEAVAEAYFRRASAVARRQEARWWELRATTSLCRLVRASRACDDPCRAEAREMLAEVYAWFEEGFSTRDLQEARALLDEWCDEPPSGPVSPPLAPL